MIDSWRFMRQSLRNFRQMGSIVPSSPHLAKAMLRSLDNVTKDQVLIELGPGTGAITKHICRNFPQNRLISVEFDERFSERLQHRYPNITVVNGCASSLEQHLTQLGISLDNIGGIISSLPLLSLPEQLRDSIIASIAKILPQGRCWVQYTYSRKRWEHFWPQGFHLERTKRVFFNVPPAVVLPFSRIAE